MTHKPGLRDYLGISLFWFAISFFWGAMLTLVIPHRVEQLVGPQNKDHVLTLIFSVGAFVASGSQILFGALSDQSRHRMGRRRPFLIVGTILATLCLFAFPGARTIGALLGAYVAVQLFLNVGNGPYQALIPDVIPPASHGKASAFMGVAMLLGRIGGAAASGILLGKANGLSILMIVFAVLLNGFMLANVFLIREVPLTEETPGVRETLRTLFKVPLKPYPSFVWLLISRFGIMMGVYTVNFCLLYYVEDALGMKENALKVVTAFLMLSTVTGIAATIPAGKISDKMSKKVVLYAANGICMLAGFVFMLAQSLPPAYAAVAVFGAGFGVFSAVDWALACNVLPEREPARYMGIWGISDTLPQVIAPLIAGPIAFAINSASGHGLGYRVLMGLAMFYFGLGTFAIRFIKERALESFSAPPVEA